MALINNYYIHVVDEKVETSVESSTHPVESGIVITDTVKPNPKTIDISGMIVDAGFYKASEIISALEKLMGSGSLIKYSGQNIASNMQIQSFNHSHPNTVFGGCEFDITLKEVRFAQPSYKAPVDSGSQETTSTTEPKVPTTPNQETIEVGSTVIFKGGSVYISSDAKKATVTRNRSTCKVEKISTASWSIHQYCLKSTDGGMVYGWCDKADIEVRSDTTVKAITAQGTKQISNGDGEAVYHTVKQGNTVYGLVNGSYKSLGTSVQWVVDNNPTCFSKKGDPTTLKIDSKLLMGYKK